jgi:hypothetical protein
VRAELDREHVMFDGFRIETARAIFERMLRAIVG